jgi:iron complex transport system ATP-binding protein
MSLALNNVRIARGNRTLVEGLNAAPASGSLTLIAGPNGVGKSTLLEALAGDAAPAAGQVLLDGQPLHRLKLAQRARCRAFLPQRVGVAFAFPVIDVVAMGLAPFGLSAKHGPGRAIVEAAMADADVTRFAGRPATQLSGGEQQRVHIARTLAQVEAAFASGIAHPLLLLDEPLTGLDYAHQFALMRRFARAARDGASVFVSLHDLVLGAPYADWMLLMAPASSGGHPPRFAPPASVLTAEIIAEAFALSPCEAARVLAATSEMTNGAAAAIAAE